MPCKMRASVVLILVLVEHTLRDLINKGEEFTNIVLILVLVEHTLRVVNMIVLVQRIKVLILVLVEHTLRVSMTRTCVS